MASEPGKKSTLLLISSFVVLGLSLVFVNHYESKVLSGARAYIAGEGQWTKAQKLATLTLFRYIDTQNESYYSQFEGYLEVNEGDRIARIELNSENPNYDVVRAGFIQGNNLERNINDMIWLYENFIGYEPFRSVVSHWEIGDEYIEKLREVGRIANQRISESDISIVEKEQFAAEIQNIDEMLTELEAAFSYELNLLASQISRSVYWLNVLTILLLTTIVGVIAVIQLRAFKTWNRKVQQSEKRFEQVLNNSRDVIYQLDIKTGKYVYMSPSIKDLTGYDIEEVMEGGVSLILDRIHPDDFKRMEGELIDYNSEDVESKLKEDSQFRIKKKNGDYVWINNKRTLLRDDKGNPSSVIGNVRDISDRKRYIEALDKSLKAKETLLSEIHHRVKNNLSIVSSLVELQKSKSVNTTSVGLKEIQSRIKSIALVHEKLYESETLEHVNLANYIDELLQMIHNTYESEKQHIIIVKNLKPVDVDIKKAVPVGLICNELFNNCYKYAFDDKDDGEIRVEVKEENDNVVFSVADNGKGMPENFDYEKSNTLGMTLVNILTRQLSGEIIYSSKKGAKFEITFPLS